MSLPSPDFLIIGAMKCGTTTLHHALDEHPDVYFPSGEVKFFTIDDFEQQRSFFVTSNTGWIDRDFRTNYERYVDWYNTLYSARRSEKLAGEDAPSYLASKKAPVRIAAAFPDIKLIVVLRDPVERTWSHYWHNVRNYNCVFSFEDALRYAPELLIDRSCYRAQIERFLPYFGRNQLLFLIFEEFIADFHSSIKKVSDFVGLQPFHFQTVHSNKTAYPARPWAALFRNFVYRDRFGNIYQRILPDSSPSKELSLAGKAGLRLLNRLASFGTGNGPSMSPETRAFLTTLLRRENTGLDDLLERDLSKIWPTFSLFGTSNSRGADL